MDNKLIFYNGRFVKSKVYYNLLKDRGFNFGESVYEVIRFCDRILICFDDHIDRLEKGLSELRIENPLKKDEWKKICLNVANQYGKRECIVYIQVTGGSVEREHFVKERPKPNYVVFCQDIPHIPEYFNIILFPEIRWKWAHLKTTNLLPNVMVKYFAKQKGFDEALFFDEDGSVKEGSSTNIFYIKDKVFFTPSLNGILPGVTRKRFIEFLKNKGYLVFENKVMIWDLFEADGVFLTGTSTELKPVKSINKISIKVFPYYKELEKEFVDYLLKISRL
ncbi:MAG: aminotransferase class IV [Candidatus Hydrothermales bacterium]